MFGWNYGFRDSSIIANTFRKRYSKLNSFHAIDVNEKSLFYVVSDKTMKRGPNSTFAIYRDTDNTYKHRSLTYVHNYSISTSKS